MEHIIHPLRAYTGLLEREGLLTAPVPEGLDLDLPVALVSYDSREVVPNTLFQIGRAHV